MELLAALRLAAASLPPALMQSLCNLVYFTCCNVKVLFNLRLVTLRTRSHAGGNAALDGGVRRAVVPDGHRAAAGAEQTRGGDAHLRRLQQPQQPRVPEGGQRLLRPFPRAGGDGLGDAQDPELERILFSNIIRIGRVPIIPIILNIYDIRPDLAINLLLLEPNPSLAVACLLKIGQFSEALRRAVETADPELVFAVISFAGDQWGRSERET